MKRILIATLLLCSVALGSVRAQTGSLESRLRDQLRETRSQLQEIQLQQSQWITEKQALEKERDEARNALSLARAPRPAAAVSPEASRLIADERTRRESAEAQVLRSNADMKASSVSLRTSETERATLAKALETSRAQVDACTARNVQMYRVGKEVVQAYEDLDITSVVAARQPFAARARVKLENAAQSFGDRLYDQRFDPRSAAAAGTP